MLFGLILLAGLAAQHPFAASGPPERDADPALAELRALYGPGDLCGGFGASHPDCDCCPLPGDIWPARPAPVPVSFALQRLRWPAPLPPSLARAPLRLGPIRGPPLSV